ncbi:hypothetical protein RCL1_003461 [Eukaryota sp. TZLM3-RCL]
MNVNALLASADTLVKKGNHAEAVTLFTELLHLKPDDPSYLLKRARSSILIGDTTSAINDVNIVLKNKTVSAPTKAEAFLILGDSYYSSGELEKACVTYHRGLRVRPLAALTEGVTRSELAILSAVQCSSSDNRSLSCPCPSSLPSNLKVCRALTESTSLLNLPERGSTPVFSSPSPLKVPHLKLSSPSLPSSAPLSARSTSSFSSTCSTRRASASSSLVSDKRYLNDLLKDTSLYHSPRTPRECRRDRKLSELNHVDAEQVDEKVEKKTLVDLVGKGISFIGKREVFWKERSGSVPNHSTANSARLSSSPRSKMQSTLQSKVDASQERSNVPSRRELATPSVPTPLPNPPLTPRYKQSTPKTPKKHVLFNETKPKSTTDSQLHQRQLYLLESLANIKAALETGAPKLAVKIGTDLVSKLKKTGQKSEDLSSSIDNQSFSTQLIEARARDALGLAFMVLDDYSQAFTHLNISIKIFENYLSNFSSDNVVLELISTLRHCSKCCTALTKHFESAVCLSKAFPLISNLTGTNFPILKSIKFLIDEAREWIFVIQEKLDENFVNKCRSAINQAEILLKFDANQQIPEISSEYFTFFLELIVVKGSFLHLTGNHIEAIDCYSVLLNYLFKSSVPIDEYTVEILVEKFSEYSENFNLFLEYVAGFGSAALAAGKFQNSRFLHDLAVALSDLS